MAVWYSLWSFVIFYQFGIFGSRKIWQPWRRGIVVIASASRTEDPGFESRQVFRSLYIEVLLSKLYMYICTGIV
jgi:hypothetical protein